jgi:sugar lactone lactonase YvrE
MGRFLQLVLVLAALLIGYLTLWPTPVNPVAWEAPETEGYTGPFAANTRLAGPKLLPLARGHGPEDIVIDANGLIYTGVEDGAILTLDPVTGASAVFANTGGRPLGLEFDAGGNLIVADAYKGLLSISPAGKISVLADKAEDGSVIGYADDLDITPDGVIWFSDASTKFIPPDWNGTEAASLPEIWEHKGTGRILRYDPATGDIATVATDIVFANGVAADPDGQFILYNETGTYRVMKYWVAGPQKGRTESFIGNLPGFPDNINRDKDGTYLLGLVAVRSTDVDRLAGSPFLRKMLWRIPGFSSAVVPPQYSHLVRLDADGKVVETWQDPSGAYPQVTGGVRGADDTIYVSSLSAPTIAVLPPSTK